ncbi:TonB-dependent receptor [Sphingomicrobium sp. XHP0235]|uniref:TonB-dependent receptor n=1 Tax=Sphingomicrobium aquimarinum TaxID=3133971 RepID=UPI0031FF42F9
MKKATLRAAASAFAIVGAAAGTAFIGAAPAIAQDLTSAQLSGQVTDDNGNAVSGAEVMLVSESTGQRRSTTTGSSGNYRFGSVAPGTYNLIVMRDGAEVYRAEDFRLLGSQNAEGNVVLSSDEGIVIVGQNLFINDFEGTTIGLNVDVEELTKRVPLPRDLTSVVLLAPGTTQGDSAFGNLASIGGSSVAENAYYVNGLNITNFDNYLGSARVPFDFYRSVEAKTGGYPAEFGRATGGIVNAVTKSGSNEFFGAVHLDWSPDFLRSTAKDFQTCQYNDVNGDGADPTDPISCQFSSNQAADEADSYSAVIEAGLPIIRDRLFVYGLLELRESDSFNVSRTTGLATRNLQDDPFYGIKVDAYPIDSQHLEFTLFDTRRQTEIQTADYTEVGNEYNVGTFADTGLANFGGVSYVGKYTGNFTNWLTVSAAYGKMEDRFDNVALGSAAQLPYTVNFSGTTVDGTPNGAFLNGQTTLSVSPTYETEREFYRGDVDLYVDVLGEHHIRGGFEVEETALARGTVRSGAPFLNGNGLISDAAFDANAGSAGYAIILRPSIGGRGVAELNYFNSGGVFEGRNLAFYIQDEWRPTERLTLNLGLRRDDFKLFNAQGDNFLSLEDNYAPRLGFTYDLWDDEQGKLYGFFGQYFLPVASNTAFRGAGAEYYIRERFFYDTFDNNGIPNFQEQLTAADNASYDDACPFGLTPFSSGSNCNVTGDGSVPSSEEFFASNLEATKQSEYIVGYEHDFGGFTAGLAYIHRNLDRTAEDAAIDAAANRYCESLGFSAAECSSVWTGYHQYVTFNIGSEATFRLLGDELCDDDPRLCDVVTFSADELGLPAAERTYDALEFTFNRPWDGVWSLRGSYTLSRSYGNSEGYVQSDFGQDDAGITQDFDQPGFTDYATGRLPNDRTHRIKLFGAFSPLEGLVFGSNLSIDSPRPLSCFGFHPTDVFANGYGAASHYCNLQPAPRGEGSETDWVATVDLSTRYNIDFGQDRLVSFTVDVFNIFNTQAVTQRNEFGDQSELTFNAAGAPTSVLANPNYDLPSGYQAPRSLRLGLDIEF